MEIVCIFIIVATLITEVLFKHFLIYTPMLRVDAADNEAKWMFHFPDDNHESH